MLVELSGVFGFLLVDLGLVLRDLLLKTCDLGLGGGTSFTLLLHDLDGAKDLLLERLELVCADGGGCAHAGSLKAFSCFCGPERTHDVPFSLRENGVVLADLRTSTGKCLKRSIDGLLVN